MWRLAKSLETLRDQIDEAYPKRSKVSDGTIGDLAHSNRTSDHNPNLAGVVTAFDITNDAKGPNLGKLLNDIKDDKRVKYIIYNRRIYVGGTWKTYTGSNPHTKHGHVSVGNDYDNNKEWSIGMTPTRVKTLYKLLANPATAAQVKYWTDRPEKSMLLAMAKNLKTKVDNLRVVLENERNKPPVEVIKEVEKIVEKEVVVKEPLTWQRVIDFIIGKFRR